MIEQKFIELCNKRKLKELDLGQFDSILSNIRLTKKDRKPVIRLLRQSKLIEFTGQKIKIKLNDKIKI